MPYHWHVDRLPLLVFGPLAIAVVLLVIAMGIRQAVTRFRSRQTPEQIKVTYEAYLRRLLNPQPEAVEKELGMFLPERLLQLYEDKSAIQSVGFQLEKPGKQRWRPKRWPVYCFEPLGQRFPGHFPRLQWRPLPRRNRGGQPRRISEHAPPAMK